jgi:ABC-type glycerol-3-phosphate transport system permease component
MTSVRPSLPHVVINGTLIVVCLLWLLPTFGLFVSSLRTRDDVLTTGWWLILPHREWVTVEKFTPPPDIDRNQPMTFEGVTGMFAKLRTGVATPDGRRVVWVGNKRNGWVEIQELRWASLPQFTLQNYRDVLTGKTYDVTAAIVGVILNLAVWFAHHVLFPEPGRIDWFALAVALVAFGGMLRWKWGVVPVVLGSALVGLLYRSL